jgi:general nucleoside transport system ATP-binding protein
MQSNSSAVLARPEILSGLPKSLNLKLEGISKTFGSVCANDSVSCEINSGGIHALLGENGAGKSTLMKVLCGYYQPDAGAIYLNEKRLILNSPTDARRLGIGMVHQQFTLVPSLTVLENVLLGDKRTPFFLDLNRAGERVASVAAQFGFDVDVYLPVWRLSMAERQKVELLKLLWRDARVIILDEPTSQLAPFEAEDILQTVQALAKQGRIVVFISHHLDEILRFSDNITVLRKGQLVANVSAMNVQADELARMLVDKLPPATPRTRAAKADAPKVEISCVSLKGDGKHRPLNNISLSLFPGEILGIAGVVGSGQDELAEILAGHIQPDGGSLLINGQPASWHTLKNPRSAAAYIPAEPRKCSIMDLPVSANLVLRDIHKSANTFGIFLRRDRLKSIVDRRFKIFEINPRDPDTLAGNLSGGNLQRVFLAREFSHVAPVLIAVNPSAGLDVSMSQRVRSELRKQASNGRAVVLVSPDVHELLDTADRVAVLCAGKLVGVEPVEDLNQQTLGLLLGGIGAEIVRSITRCLEGDGTPLEVEAKATLLELLASKSAWQRRLAAQLALNTFEETDILHLEKRSNEETDPLCQAWLALGLAKLDPAAHCQNLENGFGLDAAPYVEAARTMFHCDDLIGLRRCLQAPIELSRDPWIALLTRLVSRHLMETADWKESERSAPSDTSVR